MILEWNEIFMFLFKRFETWAVLWIFAKVFGYKKEFRVVSVIIQSCWLFDASHCRAAKGADFVFGWATADITPNNQKLFSIENDAVTVTAIYQIANFRSIWKSFFLRKNKSKTLKPDFWPSSSSSVQSSYCFRKFSWRSPSAKKVKRTIVIKCGKCAKRQTFNVDRLFLKQNFI